MNIQSNLQLIEENISRAILRSGRKKNSVKLLPVTKTMPVNLIEEVLNYGYNEIGENKVQELNSKYDFLKDRTNFHFIGALQTNKVKYIIDKVKLIHSLDRISLCKELDKRAKNSNIIINTLIEVNVMKENTKSGVYIEEVIPFIEEIIKFENIKVNGLMTVAPHSKDEKMLHNVFSTIRKLSEKISSLKYGNNISMDTLSMGMSNDYEIAIEEGATIVRLGTLIFGSRNLN